MSEMCPGPVSGLGEPRERRQAGVEAAAVVDRVWWTMVGGWARGNACAPALPQQSGRTPLCSGAPCCHLLFCACAGPLPRMGSTTCLCLPKSCSSIILALCRLPRAACSDFSALSPVPLPEASALPCLQLPLELSVSVPWGSWVSVAVGSSSRLRPSRDSALCP